MARSGTSAPVAVGLVAGRRSDASLRFAIDEAVLRAVPLVIAVAFYPPVDPDIEDIGLPIQQLERDHAHDVIAAIDRVWTEPDGPLPPYRIQPIVGSLPDVLAGLTPPPALVVIGLHHRHMLERLLHGRRPALPTITHSRVPVVVVPEPDE